jgi:hypothetical protein
MAAASTNATVVCVEALTMGVEHPLIVVAVKGSPLV